MNLIKFRIRMYKGIIDSDWVHVNNLTVLVGKNESGKTSLLKALHKLNPPDEELYEMEKEWPRGRLDEYCPNHVVCRARFRLSEQERSSLVQITGKKEIPDVVEASRDYAGKLDIDFAGKMSLDEFSSVAVNIADINAILDNLPEVPNNCSDTFKKYADNCLEEVKGLVRDERFIELKKLTQKHEPLLLAERVQPNSELYIFEGQFISRYLSGLDKLVQSLPVQSEVSDYLIEHLPKFIYMDDYRIFTGTAQLDQVKARQESKSLTEEDKTFLIILGLSGLNLNQLVEVGENDVEAIKKRQNILVGGGANLTDIISPRFKQRKYTIDYRVDGQHFFTNVKDKHDPTAIALEERSRGFQWFFSFDLMLMHETKGAFKGCVILFDEPGLHLHPGAQQDLLRCFEEYAMENTLLYTTHLPFMIDLNYPDRIRILKETGKEIAVTTYLTESDLKSRLVLQSALGMRASQSFLVANRNLVVEGIHDYWILTELSNLLERSGKKGLPEDVFITPSGGATKAVPIVKFMIGQDLDVVALFDSDKDGKDAKDDLVNNWFTKSQKESHTDVILIGKAVGACGDFELEDLFADEDFYVKLVKETYKNKLAAKGVNKMNLQGKGMLWDKVEGFFKEHGIENPNKGSVAKKLRDKLRQMKNASELPEEIQKKTLKLFQAIRRALGEKERDSSNLAVVGEEESDPFDLGTK